jgi:hypothetical protein
MPIFNHGKNTRVLYSNPSWQGTNILATWDSTAQTITIVSANAPIYEGMYVLSEAFESIITSVSYSLAGAVITIADNISNTVTTPQSVFIAGVGYSSYYMSYYNGYTADLSKYFNSADVSRAIDATETTTFRTGDTKSYITGLGDGTIDLSGMYEGTVQGTDAFFSAVLANQNTSPATYQYQLPAVVVFPGGEQTSYSGEIPSNLGKDYRCHLASGVNTKYDLKSPVAGVVTADMEVQASGGVWNGIGQYFNLLTSGYVSYTASTTGYDNKTPSDKGGLLVTGMTAKSSAPVPTYTSTFQGTSLPSLPVTVVGDSTTFQANSLPSLPLTITTGDNDVFQFVHNENLFAFTIAANTYSTVGDVASAMSSALSSDETQTFGAYLTQQYGTYGIGVNGEGIEINVPGQFGSDYIGANGAIACGFTTNPTFGTAVYGNSYFEYVHGSTTTAFNLPSGTYSTIGDLESAISSTIGAYFNGLTGYSLSIGNNGEGIYVQVVGNYPDDYFTGGGRPSSAMPVIGFSNPTYPSISSSTPPSSFYVLQFADSADGTTWTSREYLYSEGQTANTTGVFEITGPIQRYTQMQVIVQGTNANFQGYYGFARY